MDFSVEFYETAAGHCPVREFLDELKASDPGDFATVLAGLAKLQNRRYHAEPLSKALGHGKVRVASRWKAEHQGPLVFYEGTAHCCGSCCTQQGSSDPDSRLTDSAGANG